MDVKSEATAESAKPGNVGMNGNNIEHEDEDIGPSSFEDAQAVLECLDDIDPAVSTFSKDVHKRTAAATNNDQAMAEQTNNDQHETVIEHNNGTEKNGINSETNVTNHDLKGSNDVEMLNNSQTSSTSNHDDCRNTPSSASTDENDNNVVADPTKASEVNTSISPVDLTIQRDQQSAFESARGSDKVENKQVESQDTDTDMLQTEHESTPAISTDRNHISDQGKQASGENLLIPSQTNYGSVNSILDTNNNTSQASALEGGVGIGSTTGSEKSIPAHGTAMAATARTDTAHTEQSTNKTAEKSWAVSGIHTDTFTSNDIVMGKGNGINCLPGNVKYRQLINQYKPIYMTTPRCRKHVIADKILQEIATTWTPPGRFLQSLPNGGGFESIPYKRAVEKTCQALREKSRATVETSVSNKTKSGVSLRRPPKSVLRSKMVSAASKDGGSGDASVDDEMQVECDDENGAFQVSVPTPLSSINSPEAVKIAADAVAQAASDAETAAVAASVLASPDENDDAQVEPYNASTDGGEFVNMDDLRDCDVIYGGRGRKYYKRLANRQFHNWIKQGKERYWESTNAKRDVAWQIIQGWCNQFTPAARFLKPQGDNFVILASDRVLEKTCQAMRDLKRDRMIQLQKNDPQPQQQQQQQQPVSKKWRPTIVDVMPKADATVVAVQTYITAERAIPFAVDKTTEASVSAKTVPTEPVTIAKESQKATIDVASPNVVIDMVANAHKELGQGSESNNNIVVDPVADPVSSSSTSETNVKDGHNGDETSYTDRDKDEDTQGDEGMDEDGTSEGRNDRSFQKGDNGDVGKKALDTATTADSRGKENDRAVSDKLSNISQCRQMATKNATFFRNEDKPVVTPNSKKSEGKGRNGETETAAILTLMCMSK